MDNTVIKFIFIFPRNKNYASYLINNSEEFHVLKYESMYKFLCKYLKPPNTIKVRNLLYGFRKFFIDVGNQKVIELSINQEEELKKLKEKQSINLKNIEKEKNKSLGNNLDKEIKKYSKINTGKIIKSLFGI